jgi:hypothetical protein
MNTQLTKLILSLAVILFCSIAPAQAAIVSIDDFASGVPLSSFGTTQADNDGFHSGVIGGYRDTAVTATGGLNIFYSPIIGGTVAFDSLAGGSGFYRALYDGPGLDGSLNLDLLGVASDGQFSLVVLDANGNGDAHVHVLDNSGHGLSVIDPISNGFSGVLNFSYTDYLLAGVDLTDIKSISLVITSSGVADDFTFGAFTATNVVPEPASFSLLALGGLLVLRRRNRERLV